MPEIVQMIAYIALAIFLAAGVVSCMRGVVWLLIRPLKNSETIIRVYLGGKSEDVEFTLRAAVSRMRWAYGGINGGQILCIDQGMTAECRRICEIFSEKYPLIKIVEEDR